MIKLMWLLSDNDPDLKVVNRDEWRNFRFILGRKSIAPPLLKFKSNSPKGLRDCMKHGVFIIISGKIKEILEEYTDVEKEFIPIIIEKGNPLDVQDYYILNVLTACDCIDFEKSNLKMEFGMVLRINKLILADDKMVDKPLFVINKSCAQLLAFRNDLAERLKQIEGIGIKFVNPDEYTV